MPQKNCSDEYFTIKLNEQNELDLNKQLLYLILICNEQQTEKEQQ